MRDVYLGLGSNLGDRKVMLRAALDQITALPDTRVVAESSIYETPPMGPQDQGPYLNMAAKITTPLDARALVEQLQAIEIALGRHALGQRRHWGPREIDLDVLLFGDVVIDEPGLTLPHPGMHERWFVLKPLAEIGAAVVHPVLGSTVQALLAALERSVPQGVSP